MKYIYPDMVNTFLQQYNTHALSYPLPAPEPSGRHLLYINQE